jgi:hypothetical protein
MTDHRRPRRGQGELETQVLSALREAVRAVGDRRTVARAIGGAALISRGTPAPTLAGFAVPESALPGFAVPGPVPRRVAVLLGPAPATRTRPSFFTAVGAAVRTAAAGAAVSAMSSANSAPTLALVLHAATPCSSSPQGRRKRSATPRQDALPVLYYWGTSAPRRRSDGPAMGEPPSTSRAASRPYGRAGVAR